MCRDQAANPLGYECHCTEVLIIHRIVQCRIYKVLASTELAKIGAKYSLLFVKNFQKIIDFDISWCLNKYTIFRRTI